jgi:hypothetical protein
MIRLAAIVLMFVPALARADSIEVPPVPNWGSGETYAAIGNRGHVGDDQTSIIYNTSTKRYYCPLAFTLKLHVIILP